MLLVVALLSCTVSTVTTVSIMVRLRMTRKLIVTCLRSELSLCPLDSSPMTTTADEKASVIVMHSVLI